MSSRQNQTKIPIQKIVVQEKNYRPLANPKQASRYMCWCFAVSQRESDSRIPDDATLLTDSPVHGLPDPPVGVRGELEAPSVIKALYGLDQTDNALSNEIRHLHAPVHVLACHRHHQALIAHDHLLLCVLADRKFAYEGAHVRCTTRPSPLSITRQPAQLLLQLFKDLFTSKKLLDVYGELHLLSCCQQVGACLRHRKRCEL